MFRSVFTKRLVVTLTSFLCVSVFLNVYFLRKVRLLSETVNRAEVVPEGQVAPELVLIGPDGNRISVNYSEAEGGTVLYVVRASCIWCARNKQSVRALASRVGRKYRFLGLSLDRIADVNSDTSPGFPVFAVSRESAAAYRLSATPQTIVVSGKGIIERTWRGAYVEPNLSELQRFFNVEVPAVVF